MSSIASDPPPNRARLALIYAAIAAVGVFELAVAWEALHPRVPDNYRAYYIDQSTTCLDKPVSGQYTLGTVVSFMPPDQTAARKIRVCGWDGPAGDGTHSVGEDSLLHLVIPKGTGALVLNLEFTAIIGLDNRDQTIAVSVNGVPVGEATTPAGLWRSVDFAIPQKALDAVPGVLDIRIDYPTAAEMTPHDSNTHYRAIKLRSLQVRRPGDPPSTGGYDPGQHDYAG